MWNLFRQSGKNDNTFPPKINNPDHENIIRMLRSLKFINEILDDCDAGDSDNVRKYNITPPLKRLIKSQLDRVISNGINYIDRNGVDYER